MFRKILFWSHLVAGLATGLVVFMMSATGVILMYERQLRAWVAEGHYVPAEQQGERLAFEQLLAQASAVQPEVEFASLVLTNDPGAPVELRAGRRGGAALNPYTGEPMETRSESLEGFLSAVTGWHRWFNVTGDGRAFAREVTGVSNVVFLFLVLSGMYLWLPSIYKWALFKARLLLRGSYPNSKARDFHWHHIFGIWTAIPLIAVVYSGMVISYPWAANFMYRVFGAEVPTAQQGPGAGGGAPAPANAARSEVGGRAGRAGRSEGGEGRAQQAGSIPAVNTLPLAGLIEKAIAHSEGDWQRLTVTLPKADASNVQIEIDRGNGAQAHKRYTLSLDRTTGNVASVRTFADTPEAQRLRGIARFLHTGEVLGFWGQTIAGIASFAALFMVWTGFALSYRRLIQPLFKPKS